MSVVTVDDILSDLPLGFASLILRPAPSAAAIERFLILDADDGPVDASGAFVLLIGVRGRTALPALRRLLRTPPPVVAVKGSRDDLAEVEELIRAAGAGLLLVDPGADWDRLLSIAKDRIQPRSYQSEVLTLLEEDLFAIAQTTARLTSSHVVIEDAANKVLAYSTVTNDIDEPAQGVHPCPPRPPEIRACCSRTWAHTGNSTAPANRSAFLPGPRTACGSAWPSRCSPASGSWATSGSRRQGTASDRTSSTS
ncbi:hypothetical protein NG819_00470 [Pseudarthrobacter sp. Fe7]|nr:hypothetical protein NG819_00470 [Pseudarthrobacter sp. Fe7]